MLFFGKIKYFIKYFSKKKIQNLFGIEISRSREFSRFVTILVVLDYDKIKEESYFSIKFYINSVHKIEDRSLTVYTYLLGEVVTTYGSITFIVI